MTKERLVRSKSERIIAGVCGGIAQWLGWDPTLVRILYIVISIATAFSGLIAYIILWIIMPEYWYFRNYSGFIFFILLKPIWSKLQKEVQSLSSWILVRKDIIF